MKIISQIYQQYQIMAALQLHQYRVAAVAALIVDHFDQSVERPEIISACLLHDMGNILKFDLSVFPEFLEPEGLAYWQKVKADYQAKYGSAVHEATQTIIAEIGVSARTTELIRAVSYDGLVATLNSHDWAKIICEYCDLRVTPQGITSIEARWTDLKLRYSHKFATPADLEKRRVSEVASLQAEQVLFTHCSLLPHQITETSANDTIKRLPDFVVS